MERKIESEMKTKSPLLHFPGSAAAPAPVIEQPVINLPIARTGDPATSKLAGQELTVSGKRQTLKARVLDALRRYPNRTSAELAAASGFPHATCHKRLPDLEHDGKVEKTAARACTVTGKQAVTWRVVQQQALPAAVSVLGGNRLR